MSDVDETLQQLVARRLREMGKERGRHDPLSLLEAFRALPAPPEGQTWVTYELLRRVLRDGHRNIGGRATRTLATMLAVTPDTVARAARQRPPLDRFELPEHADRLEPAERQVVLAVIDTILRAGGRVLREDAPMGPPEAVDAVDVVTPDDQGGPGSHQRRRRPIGARRRPGPGAPRRGTLG